MKSKFRDEGMDYDKILKRIDEEKAKRLAEAKAENKKAKEMGRDDQLVIVSDILN